MEDSSTDTMEHAEIETPVIAAADAPNSLGMLLDPAAALEAARRMQHWYQSTPQGAAHSLFGRDGRRVEGRPRIAQDDESDTDSEAG
ncbi:MAG: hypothetical protein RJA99_2540 [Pseudomonadota bacterium]|jgi:hypothetical protein